MSFFFFANLALEFNYHRVHLVRESRSSISSQSFDENAFVNGLSEQRHYKNFTSADKHSWKGEIAM